MFESVKRKQLLSLYEQKEKLQILKKEDNLKEICDYINSNFKELEKCKVALTRADIAIKINNSTTYSAFLWQQELVAMYRVYATILGIIDARQDYCENSIEFYSKFEGTENDILEVEKKSNKYQQYREKILEDYLSMTNSSEPKIINTVLRTNHSYDLFAKLFDDMINNHYNISLQGEVVSSYMKGYNASMRFYPEKVMDFYDKKKARFDKKMSKMTNDIEKVKKLMPNQEINY